MQNNAQEIIETYRREGIESRLSLFLQCPELRNAFIEIDQNDYKREEPSRQNRWRILNSIRSLCGWILSPES